MPTKIIYFLADRVATPEEEADIEKLNSLAFTISVMNGQSDSSYGDNIAPCDYVAGTVPEAYSDKNVLDPSDLPGGGGPTVSNGDPVQVRNSTGADSHTGTAVVEEKVFTGVNLEAASAIVDDADSFPTSDGGNVVLTVANGVISSVVYTAPVGARKSEEESTSGVRKSEEREEESSTKKKK